MSHSKYKRCRILENNIWKKYLQLGVPPLKWWEKILKKRVGLSFSRLKLPEQMLIYHWTEKNKEENADKVIDHFSAFAKFSQRKTGFLRMTSVVLFVLGLGITASILANLSMRPLDNVWNFMFNSVESDESSKPDADVQDKKPKDQPEIDEDETNKNDCE